MATLSPAKRAVLFRSQWTPRKLGSALVLWLDASSSPMTLDYTAYAGTGVVSQTGTTLTGVGSAFLSEVKVGDLITATGISENVVSIASDTSLTLTSSLSSGAGLTYTITPVAGSSDRVSQWNDLSGRGNHAVQATASARPALLYGANGIGGKAALSFDDVDDYLLANGVASILNGTDKAVTVAGVVKVASSGGEWAGFGNSASPNAYLQLDTDGTTNWRWDRRDNALGDASQDVSVGSTVGSWALVYTDTGVVGSFYHNGRLLGGASASSNVDAMTIDRFSIGAQARNTVTNFWPGLIGEIVVCNRVLTAHEVTQLSTYLKRKYGTP